MAGKTKPKKKQPLDMRSKMYLVLALCSVMLLVCIGISLALIGWFPSRRPTARRAFRPWTANPW